MKEIYQVLWVFFLPLAIESSKTCGSELKQFHIYTSNETSQDQIGKVNIIDIEDLNDSSGPVGICQSSYMSCDPIDISVSDVLDRDFLTFPAESVTLFKYNFYDFGKYISFSYYSVDGGDYGTLTVPSSGTPNMVFGTVHYASGKNFMIEAWDEGKHFWIQGKGDEIEETRFNSEKKMESTQRRKFKNQVSTKVLADQDSKSSIDARLSVMLYYTMDFWNVTLDKMLEPYFVNTVNVMNEALRISGVTWQITSYCFDTAWNLEESATNSEMLYDFLNWKDSPEIIRNDQDISILFTRRSACSDAFPNSPRLTLGTVTKSCSAFQFGFAHAIGYMFGCGHDPESGYEPNPDAENSDFYLAYNVEGTSYRTIMAHHSESNPQRIHFFSNDNYAIMYLGHQLGSTYQNNARKLQISRKEYEDIGNEYGYCPPSENPNYVPNLCPKLRHSTLDIYCTVLFSIFYRLYLL